MFSLHKLSSGKQIHENVSTDPAINVWQIHFSFKLAQSFLLCRQFYANTSSEGFDHEHEILNSDVLT